MSAARGPSERAARSRSERAHQAILDATIALLAEREVAALTMDEIAAHAGSSKATIYRRWSSKEEVLAEALGRATRSQPPPDTGTLRGDLLLAVQQVIEVLTQSPLGRALPALVAAKQSNPELHEFILRTVGEPRRELLRAILRRGIARGELDPETDLDLFMDLIGGPIHFRRLVTQEPVDAAYAERLIDAALRAFAPPGG